MRGFAKPLRKKDGTMKMDGNGNGWKWMEMDDLDDLLDDFNISHFFVLDDLTNKKNGRWKWIQWTMKMMT